MKKAKILIPSLSVLCFSALACVTGSVAWFTSVSSASLATTEFEVASMSGSMSIGVTRGVGTKVSMTGTITDDNKILDGSTIVGYKNADTISVEPDTYTPSGGTETAYKLTHGSYDCANSKAYVLNKFSTDTNKTYDLVSNAALTKSNQGKYIAKEGVLHLFSWTIEFNYDFGGATNQQVNLYYDVTNFATDFTKVTKVSSGADTGNAFRLAFINTSSKDWVVLSPFQTAKYDLASSKSSSYIGTSSTVTTAAPIAYDTAANGNLIYKGDTSVAAITGTSATSTRKDCLGSFYSGVKDKTDTSSITIQCVAWYEGDDPNLVNAGTLNKVKSTLKFIVKGNAAA